MSETIQRQEHRPLTRDFADADAYPRTAVLSQSNRTWQIEAALAQTPIEYEIDPDDPWEFDVLVIETPDRDMLQHVTTGKFKDTTTVFRMRGDPYWGIHHWHDHPFPPVRKAKTYLALKQLEWVDCCFPIAKHQAETYRTKTGNPTRIVQLSREVDNWPTITHTDHELRILSLTNCDYPTKIKPLIEYAPAINTVLGDIGGQMVIGGDGRYADRLQNAVEGLEHVSYPGYVDARARLKSANLMLHLSEFDAFAGAILEGFASHIPVVTTDHPAFTNPEYPTDTIDSETELRQTLRAYATPEKRTASADAGMQCVKTRYSHDQLGKDWADALQWVSDL